MPIKADFVIENANVFTSAEGMSQTEAVAVQGNHIVYAGTNEGAQAFKSKNTKVINGQGGTLTPGIIDSHFHLLWGAIELAGAQLNEAASAKDVGNILKKYKEDNKTSKWIQGRGVKYGIISTRQQLDAVFQDEPIYINAYDGHTSWANTKALEMAGILQPGREAAGNGVVVRDGQGLATGELRESAMYLVEDLIPLPDEARKRELLRAAIRQINAAGVTSVHNMNGDMRELMTYAALEDAGEMTLRVYEPYHIKPETTEEMLAEAAEMAKVQGEFVRGGAAKFFMDGVWESYTALNLEPYADDPNAKPEGIFSPEHFTRMAALCDQMGLQIFVHCCGDGAVRRTLDGYEAVQRSNGRRDSRHRVEHIEVIHPDDLPRFKELGVIASMQPLHSPLTANDGDVWLERTGKHRWGKSFAWREIKDAGATLALGSDWTVASFNPMLGIHSALTRHKWSPDTPDQRLGLEEALLGYTRDAAYAEFQEHQKGQLKEGYLADLVLWSADLFAIPPEETKNVQPVLTMVNGQIAYEA